MERGKAGNEGILGWEVKWEGLREKIGNMEIFPFFIVENMVKGVRL